MHIDSVGWLLIGFLVGTASSIFCTLLGSASSERTLKLVHEMFTPEPELLFEPGESAATIENQDIRISLSEEETD